MDRLFELFDICHGSSGQLPSNRRATLVEYLRAEKAYLKALTVSIDMAICDLQNVDYEGERE